MLVGRPVSFPPHDRSRPAVAIVGNCRGGGGWGGGEEGSKQGQGEVGRIRSEWREGSAKQADHMPPS